MTLNKREWIILAITLSLAGIFAINQFLIKPIQEGGEDVQTQVLVKEKQLAVLEKSFHQGEFVHKRRVYLEGLFGTNNNEGAEMSGILAIVESSASDVGVHITNMQPQGASTQKGLRSFAVEVQLIGSWPNIVKFFYALQDKPNNFFINELSLERNADASGNLSGRVVIARMRLVK